MFKRLIPTLVLITHEVVPATVHLTLKKVQLRSLAKLDTSLEPARLVADS